MADQFADGVIVWLRDLDSCTIPTASSQNSALSVKPSQLEARELRLCSDCHRAKGVEGDRTHNRHPDSSYLCRERVSDVVLLRQVSGEQRLQNSIGASGAVFALR
ncbi:unnamed protein product [Lampetra planeri]